MLAEKGEKVNMENAVIYARFSSNNQSENSIEAQVSAATDYAIAHKYNIVKTYADRAKTGTNDNREAFQEMLSDTDKKFFTVIIVWKVDRFGRNREEIALNKHRCKKNGVRVEYVAENITSGPEGVILESVLEGFAEYYSRQLSQNTKRGLKNIILKGEYSGGKIPFGYDVIDKRYVLNKEKAKKIKAVFKMFIDGYSYVEIADALDLDKDNIRYYLTNEEYYTGTLKRGGLEVENIFTPIIDKETFLKAGELLGNRPKIRKPLSYLLSGKIYCKECGEVYSGFYSNTKGKGYTYYRSGRKCKCTGKYIHIKADLIESDVLTKAKEVLLTDDTIDKLSQAVYEKLKLKVKFLYNTPNKADLLKRKKNIINAISEGTISLDDAKEVLDEINKELNSSIKVDIPSIETVKKYILEMKNLKEDKALIKAFVDRIEVDPITKSYAIKFCPSQFRA